MAKALIFDFDGTICPSEQMVYDTWRAFFRRRGHDFPLRLWARAIGGSEYRFDPGVYAEENGLGDREEVRQELAAAVRQSSQRLPINPGVRELIAAGCAAGLRLGVASSSPRHWVEGHLKRLGLLESFSSLRTRDDGEVKPSPHLYLRVLEDLQADRQDSWGIEDSGPGVRAAKSAGLRVVAIPNAVTESHDFSTADLVVSSLEEVTLERLGLR